MIKSKVLNNGIKVAVVPLKGLKAVTVEVFVKIGSKYEKNGEHGLSHFLEHMAFKGTPKRPQPSSVNQEIDSKGAGWNAGTGQEMTSYYITTVRENLPWAVEILADLLQNPIMDKTEVEKERGVVAEEIKMYRDNPAMGLGSDFYSYILGESDIGCWDIAGKVQEILSYSKNNLDDYRKAYFEPRRMTIVVAGDIGDEDKALDEVARYWEKLETKSSKLPEVKIRWTENKEKREKRMVEQGHFCIGVEGLNRFDDQRYAQKLMEVILAGNSSSKLFQAIREDRGWAYYVHLAGDSFAETGVVAVQSGVKLSEVESAVDLSEKIMLSFKETVTEDELRRAKDYVRGKMGLAMDRSDFWTGYVGEKWLLEERLETPDENIKKLEKVSLLEVKELSEKLFKADKVRKMIVKR